MTLISEHPTATHESAHPHEQGHGHEKISFLKKYIFSTDHKIIGIEFLLFGLCFFLIGGLLALLVRWQLAWPGSEIPWLGVHMGWHVADLAPGKPAHQMAMPPEFYNQIFTMHATLMIFFVIIPILVGAFGNYLIPLMIGARDMAFPFLNGAVFWMALPAGAIMVSAFFLQGGTAAAGWTSYPPLSSTFPSGVGYLAHTPYRGVTPLMTPHSDWGNYDFVKKLPPDVARIVVRAGEDWEKFGQTLRLRADGTKFDAGEKSVPGGLSLAYEGEKGDVLQAARVALIAKGYALTPAFNDDEMAGQSTAPAGEAVKKAKITVTENTITVIADEGAAGLLERLRLDLNWQSSWPAISVISTAFAIFLCYIYLCAYAVRLGFRPLNWIVSVALAAGGAYYTVKFVQYMVFDGQSAWFFSLFLLGFSSILGAVNYLTTVIKLRCPGMTMFRMPLSVWALFITSVMVLLATPVLAATLLMNLLDHHRFTSFFLPFNWMYDTGIQNASGGGYPLLHQHLFWFYSHPAVYIMILPAMGMVSDVLSVNARKPVFGYRPMIYALASIAFLGFIVWAHHMFQSGLNPTLGTTFAISTMFIAVPSAIKTFNWLGTLWGGNIRYNSANLNAIAFVSMFVIGGLSGIYMASTAVDVHIHATYFIVAHIHYVLFGASTFGIFAGIYHWYPKMFGKMLNEPLGKIHFWISFVAFNCTFFPMHILGIHGMPRRVADYTNYSSFAHFRDMNIFITISAFALGAAQIVFAINFIGSWVFGKRAGNNPWQATTLEWETSSPPPHGNFEKPPVVYHGPYEYSSPLIEEDYLLQTRFVENDVPVAAH